MKMSARNPGDLSTLDRGILSIVSPAESAMSLVARGIAGVAGRFVELAHARAENDQLAKDNARLRAEVAQLRRLADESGRYQRLLGLRDLTPAETNAARIIAIDASPYFRVARVELDRGEGVVKRGMPVLTPEGVVGRIGHVSDDTSDITLLVDPRSAIDVVVPRTGGRGILRGKPGENGYRCSIEYLTRGQSVQVGDKVARAASAARSRAICPWGTSRRSSPAPSACSSRSRSRPTSTSRGCPRCSSSRRPPPAADPDASAHRAAAVPARGPMVYR